MTGAIIYKYAARSLLRNSRRTILSLVGITAGVFLAVIAVAFIGGLVDMMTRSTIESGIGHIRIVPTAWLKTHDDALLLPDAEGILTRARALPDVVAAGERVRTNALLGFGTRVAGVPLVGVDPEAEPQFTRYLRNITIGRYLKVGDKGSVVLGKAIADTLHVGPDDDLLVTLVGEHGEFQSAMLRIVGLVDTGSRDLDNTICQVTLPELHSITGTSGAGEITLLLNNERNLPRVLASIRTSLPSDTTALSWEQVSPSLLAVARAKTTGAYGMLGIILCVIVLGVMGAQLTAALERRREFAVLSALGMSVGRIVRLLLLEATLLGLAGGCLGLLAAWPLVYYLATTGINFEKMLGPGGLASGSLLMEPIIYANAGLWLLPFGLAVAVVSTLLATIYSALFIARTDPAAAMRVI